MRRKSLVLLVLAALALVSLACQFLTRQAVPDEAVTLVEATVAVQEVTAAYELLGALGLRRRGPLVYSCPTCGRTCINVLGLTRKVKQALRDRPDHRLPEPPGVVRMWVDRSSGRPTSAGAGGAVFEAFLEAHVPQADAMPATDEVGAESVEPDADDSLF